MLEYLRTQSRNFLLVMLAVIGISFLFLYNVPSLDRMRRAELGSIDGKTITQDQFRLAYQATKLWEGMSERSGRRQGSSNEALSRQSWDRLLFVLSAHQAGLTVSDTEVTTFIQTKLGFLQKNGQFDPSAWSMFSGPSGYLSGQGISAERFIEIIREDLLIDKFQTSLVSSVHVNPAEMREAYERIFSPVHFQIIKFDPKDYLGQVKLTDEEVQKEYKDNETNPAYRVPERRVVSYAKFEYSPEDLKKAEKDRETAKRALADKAASFATELQGDGASHPDFQAVASSHQVATTETKPFGLREAVEGLPPSPGFNRAAFRLKKDEPFSEPVETSAGFYVLSLKDILPGSLRPLSEVRAVVEQNLKTKKALELANKAGSDTAISLKTASQLSSKFSAAGTKSDLKSMASSFKLKVEDVPEFVPIDARGGDTMVRMLSPLVSTLQPGELGGYQPGPEFGFIAFLKDCGAVDEKKFGEYLPNLVTQRESQRKNEILEEWRNQRLASKGTKLPPDMVAKK